MWKKAVIYIDSTQINLARTFRLDTLHTLYYAKEIFKKCQSQFLHMTNNHKTIKLKYVNAHISNELKRYQDSTCKESVVAGSK